MKLNALEKFEIQAEAFHILTGFMHPGKDTSPLCGASYEERKEAWDAWIKEHAPIVIAMMAAFEYTLPDVPNAEVRGCAHHETTNGEHKHG